MGERPAREGVRGDRVRTARKARGWNQTELAGAAGMHTGQVSDVERGICDVRAATLSSLAVALGVSADWLLGLPGAVGPVETKSPGAVD